MRINKEILGPMRVPFLILTPACVLLGIATALESGSHVNFLQSCMVLVAALCTHISVNAFNEYDDFKTGLDTRTQRTPFSGGSGTLPANPNMKPTALAIALVSLSIIILTGIYFTWLYGLALLPLGLLGHICDPGLHSLAHAPSRALPGCTWAWFWSAYGHGYIFRPHRSLFLTAFVGLIGSFLLGEQPFIAQPISRCKSG